MWRFWHFAVIEQEIRVDKSGSPPLSFWLTSSCVSKAADKGIVFIAIDIIHIKFSPFKEPESAADRISICYIAIACGYQFLIQSQRFQKKSSIYLYIKRDIEYSGTRCSLICVLSLSLSLSLCLSLSRTILQYHSSRVIMGHLCLA